MSVRVRKVGNSMVLTVPSKLADALGMYDGQSFDAEVVGAHIEYRPTREGRKKVDWSKYKLSGSSEKGTSPRDFVKSLRGNGRKK